MEYECLSLQSACLSRYICSHMWNVIQTNMKCLPRPKLSRGNFQRIIGSIPIMAKWLDKFLKINYSTLCVKLEYKLYEATFGISTQFVGESDLL